VRIDSPHAAPLRILAISGSLRGLSSNSALLRLAATVAPSGVTVEMYDGLATLPHFNPDDDGDTPPDAVLAMRARVGESDGLLFCSPEYAHGVPGSLKNALDWLVRSLEFPQKPVALINASAMATHAQASLTETLTLMTARIVFEACATIPVTRADVDATGNIASAEIGGAMRAALDAFARGIRATA
jgi:chromate reductase, NAD(P)H dehydrogenase (quinone)